MKNKLATKSLLNSCLLATLASCPFIHTGLAQTPFPSIRVGDGTGSTTTGDGTLAAEGKNGTSPLLSPTYQTTGSRMLWYPRKSAFRAGYGSSTTWSEATMGEFSFATGYENKASGYGSTAMGYYMNTASGAGATAMGYYMNTASSYGATAMGYYNTASGFASTAMGNYNTASGDEATAMGYMNTASGDVATAMGYNSTASGFASTALGAVTTASSFGETVIGSYNASTLGNQDQWSQNDPVFQIGNGHWEIYETEVQADLNGNGIIDQDYLEYLPETYSNALTVYKNGNMELQGNLTLGGTITSAGSPVLTSASAPVYGFVRATDGIINLPSTTAGISVSSGSIFSLDPSGKVNYASNRPISIASTTLSSSSVTGALTVAGGIGVSLDSWFNGVRVGRGNGSVSSNTALGDNALSANLTASSNTAIGKSALALNTSGNSNTSIGTDALGLNTTGGGNTAVGARALRSNLSSTANTAVGTNAMWSNTSGSSNTSIGLSSSYLNTTGTNNLAIGSTALYANTIGSSNIAIGSSAGRYHANGSTSLNDPENSIYIGANTRGKDNTDDNSIVIGSNAVGQGANTTVIGNSNTTSARIYGNLVAGTGTGSPVLTVASAATTSLALNPTSIRGAGSTLSNGGLLAMGTDAQANGYNSFALGGYAYANGSGSLALGSYARADGVNTLALGYSSNCASTSSYSIALTGGQVAGNYSLAASWGYANGEMSMAFGDGSFANGNCSIALGGMDWQSGSWPANQSDGENSVTIGGVGNSAYGFSSFATGFWTRASSYGAIALGSLNLGSGSNTTAWVETDSLFELGNGNAARSYLEPAASNRSNAITTLKNGQTTLTNKAWKANSTTPLADPPAATTDSGGEALVVEGHTRLKGKVIIEQPQGDISMGIYGN